MLFGEWCPHPGKPWPRTFADLSIRRKLGWLVVISTAVALFLSAAAIFSYDAVRLRGSLVREIERTATMLAHTSAAPLAFEDSGAAERVLEALEAFAPVVAASVHSSSGRPLAAYRQSEYDGEVMESERYPDEGHVFSEGFLLVVRDINSSAGSLGTLYVQASLLELREHIRRFAMITVAIAVLSFVVAVRLSSRLQRTLSLPILSLANLAGRISRGEDYSVRATRADDDEIGVLVSAFNNMLQRIQDRDAALEHHREELEELVEKRTAELLRSKESLRRSERLATVGTLAAGIAHQINNPIGCILNSAQYALMCEEDEDVRDVWKRALLENETEAKRCGRIVRSILQFSRNEPTARWSEDLNELVRRTTLLISPYASERAVTIDFIAATQPVVTLISPIEIEQVLVNILRNAIDAVEVALGEVRVMIRSDGEQAIISIADNGRGISASEIDRIFDPFFTTRLSIGGTGLGLAVAHGIVTDHGGTMEVESEPEKGSEFVVTLPIRSHEDADQPPEAG